jgi:hypothetical protein
MQIAKHSQPGKQGRSTGIGGDAPAVAGTHSLVLCEVLSLALVSFALVFASSAHAASFSRVGQFGGRTTTGELGKFAISPMPQRTTVDQRTGYLYVADPANNRVEVFEPAAGTGSCATTCASPLFEIKTPDPLAIAIDQESGDLYAAGGAVNEKQTVTLSGATGGSFTVTATTATGSGTTSSGLTEVTGVAASFGAFHVGDAITGTDIPAGTTITAVGSGTLTLSRAATAGGTSSDLEATETAGAATGTGETESGTKKIKNVTTASGAFVPGEAIEGPGIPAGATILSISGTTITLTASANFGSTATIGLTAPGLARNVSIANMKKVLEALPGIGPSNVAVTGTAGSSYAVEFTGALAATDVPQMSADAANLTPAGATATTATTLDGSVAKVSKLDPDNRAHPTSYSPDPSFTSPPQGSGAGQVGSFGTVTGFTSIGAVAVDPFDHDILLADPTNKLIQRFGPDGSPDGSFDASGSGQAFVKPADLAVGCSDACLSEADVDIYVSDLLSSTEARVMRFDGTGTWQATLTSPADPVVPNGSPESTGVALATDPLTGEFFVASKTELNSAAEIYAFSAPGSSPADSLLGHFPVEYGTGFVFGMAVASAPHRLYAVASNLLFSAVPAVQVFETLSEPPNLTVGSPAVHGPTAATLEGTVNPNGSEVTECTFQLVPLAQYEATQFNNVTVAQEHACEPSPGDGTTPVAVHTDVGGLEPNTAYRYQIVATNNGGAGRSVSGVEGFATSGAPPVVVTGEAWSLGDTTATLAGTVDPENSPVSECRFEYGPTETYGRSATCSPAPGSGNSLVQVAANLGGLAPLTTYHFRIVADNGNGGPQTGGDAAFTTRSEAEVSLPRRGYELVSAEDTNGLRAVPVAATTDGDTYLYDTPIPAPGSTNGAPFSYFRATREADGRWVQQPIGERAPGPGFPVRVTSNVQFSSDLAQIAFQTTQSNDPDDLNEEPDVYKSSLDQPNAEWLSQGPTSRPQTEAKSANLAYLSPDGRRALLETQRHWSPRDVSGSGNASLYEEVGGTYGLVGVVPPSSASSCDDAPGSAGPACVGSPTGSQLGSTGVIPRLGTTYGAVSEDGSRIAFQATDSSGHPQLYARLGGERTVQVSRSVGVTPEVNSARTVNFVGADHGMEHIFFTSSSRLTVNSTAETTGSSDNPRECGFSKPSSCDLYGFDLATQSLKDLTPAAGGGGRVQRVYFVSTDGRRIYFTSGKRLNAAGELTEEAGPGQTLEGLAGGPNLYLAEPGSTGTRLTFIAPIDEAEGFPGAVPGNEFEREQAQRPVAATEDGRVLAFRDRLNAVPGRATGGFPQVFVFDATTDQLTCASCPGDGSVPSSGAQLVPAEFITEAGTGAPSPEPRPLEVEGQATHGLHSRAVSSGGTVFFQTTSALVPDDRNGRVDVYEDHNGAVGLVSPGIGAESIFADASADGETVFFASSNSLAAGAQAGIPHIYAARVGGGAPPTLTPTPPCEGADCREGISAAPVLPGSGSTSAADGGNVESRQHHKKHKRHHRRHKRHHRLHKDKHGKGKKQGARHGQRDGARTQGGQKGKGGQGR